MLSPLFLFLGQGTFSTSLSLFVSLFLSLPLSNGDLEGFVSALSHHLLLFMISMSQLLMLLVPWVTETWLLFRQCCQAAFLHSSNGKTFLQA